MKLTFEFTVEQVNTILAMLGRGPFDAVAALIADIQNQAQPQLQSQQQTQEVEEVDPA